jgi:hypothetical protein
MLEMDNTLGENHKAICKKILENQSRVNLPCKIGIKITEILKKQSIFMVLV